MVMNVYDLTRPGTMLPKFPGRASFLLQDPVYEGSRNEENASMLPPRPMAGTRFLDLFLLLPSRPFKSLVSM
jgi:hypothetical protein